MISFTAENRRSEMEHKDFQSGVSKMTQNSRDAIAKLRADLKIETEKQQDPQGKDCARILEWSLVWLKAKINISHPE